MATLSDLLEGNEEKVKNLVVYRMYGKVYFRAKPATYNDRKSPAQLAQRQRLQVVNAFLKPFREVIRKTYVSEAKGRSALQAAQSYIMRNALAGEYPGIYVDKNRALLSRGPLPLPLKVYAEPHPEGVLVAWENDPNSGEKASSDTLVVIALFENTSEAEYHDSGVKRTAGNYLWKPPKPVTKTAMPDVWIAFRNAGMTEISDSMYLPF